MKYNLQEKGLVEGADYTEEELFSTNTMVELYPDNTSTTSNKARNTGGVFLCSVPIRSV